MLRKVVNIIWGVTGVTPDKIIMLFIIIGSLVIFEVIYFLIRRGYYLMKRIVIDRVIERNKR